MSTLSMSNAISALPKIIGSLEHILRKAEQNAEERGIDMDVLLNSRLAPDMHPLYKQVLMVCDMAKMAPYRIAGLTPPKYDCLLYTSPSPRDKRQSRMPSSA